MIYFNCDYNEGAHPAVMQRLAETNACQTIGYGCDEYCEHARELLRESLQQPDAAIHFIVGGTQANTIVIESILRPHQGVLCADSGHINAHETGAIEATGHKVLALPGTDGKITAAQVRTAVLEHRQDGSFEHIVQPGMVYISFPTEVGTLYSKAELTALYGTCRELGIPLFIDGARLGYGLASPACDLTLPEVAALCDAMTVGGTKQGLLFGEAVVLTAPALQRDFRYLIKQHGGMLAKGRLLGVQYEAIWQDGLYFALSRHAVTQALRIREALLAKGWKPHVDSPTNQQFFVLPNDAVKTLSERYVLEVGAAADDRHTVVRFCTSWATHAEAVDTLLRDIAAL